MGEPGGLLGVTARQIDWGTRLSCKDASYPDKGMSTRRKMPPSNPTTQSTGNAVQQAHRPILRTTGLGLITGPADDDCSAIGTYASAGAKLGFQFLWTAPVTLPMMFAVVYLSSKLGQAIGQGLFSVIRTHYSRWILYPALIGVPVGNTFEAGADIGGMAAALNILLPIPFPWIIIGTALAILALQIWGSYTLIRNIFRWLALTLLAYVGAAFLAKPELLLVLKGTFLPSIQFNKEFLSLLVAVIGTTLSAYLYTWQSNQEVEEKIARGRTQLWQRRSPQTLSARHPRWDVFL